jgi:hypothetical protein
MGWGAELPVRRAAALAWAVLAQPTILEPLVAPLPAEVRQAWQRQGVELWASATAAVRQPLAQDREVLPRFLAAEQAGFRQLLLAALLLQAPTDAAPTPSRAPPAFSVR